MICWLEKSEAKYPYPNGGEFHADGPAQGIY